MAGSVRGLVVGRFIVGLGVGAGSAVVPMYITEVSPAHLRSRLNTLNTVFITLGQIVAYLIGYWYSRTPFGWRPMFLLGGLPAAIQIGLLFFLPESPRWLVQHGHIEQATSVLGRIYGIKQEGSNAAERRMLSHLVRSIERGVRSENEISSITAKWRSLIGKRGNRKALLISGGLQGFQQLCGFNALMYFSALIYAMLNFKNPTLTSLSVAATNFTFTLVSLVLIPRVGKRRLLLYSVPMMALGLLAAAYGFNKLPTQEILSSHDGNSPSTTDPTSSFYAYVILFSTTFYVAAYASGIGNVPWQQAEFFPMSVRSLGTAVSTACNWSSNFIIGETFLGLMEKMGAVATFVLFAMICMVGWVGIYAIYPDTEGMNLEEIEALLSR
ncbi:hypothetical protein ABW20_dc0108992 [Dactylellina cionopaga]|nr:hypothetical protein ABW20_dc0108992 [Dactylellina cionopaga]